ncbi:CLUMA_CG017056, isoform A [Clunio marinus]|uniref:CLUMA_CG017056, isoform A n=1 Tax=Clunio marinus TaxID=568069 RepID=A0A1J1IUS5_9DIPT|nr:CLUMA_CG017056, isoform A [Clunio marinus]
MTPLTSTQWREKNKKGAQIFPHHFLFC